MFEGARSYLVRGSTRAFFVKTSGMVAALALNIVITRLLVPEDVGRYFLLLTLASVGAILGGLGLPMVVGRAVARHHGSGDARRLRDSVQRSVLITVAGSLAVGATLSLGLQREISRAVLDDIELARFGPLVSLWLLAIALEAVIAEVHRGQRRVGKASLVQFPLANMLLVGGLSIGLATPWNLDLTTVVLVTIAAHALSLVYGAVDLTPSLGRSKATRPTLPRTRERLTLPGLMLMGSGLSWFLIGQGPLWVVGAITGASDVALFGVAYRAVALIGIPLIVAGMVFPPVVVSMSDSGDVERLQRVSQGIASAGFILSLPVFLLIALLAEPLLGVLFGEFYRNAAPLVLVLAAGELVNAATGPCQILLVMTGHQGAHSIVTALGAILILGVGTLATLGVGAVGMAAVAALGTSLTNLAYVLMAHRLTGVRTHLSYSSLVEVGRFGRNLLARRSRP